MNETIPSFGFLGLPELILILFLGVIIVIMGVLPFWFICRKAGLLPWLSLIMLIPMGALILPLMLAFMDWPVLKNRIPG